MPQYELNLRDYLRILRKRKVVIAVIFFATTISSSIYLSMQKPMYVASTTVKIEERKTIAGLLTEWIVYAPADIMESQTMIIKGFPVMKKAALRLGMLNDNSSVLEVHNVVSQLQGSVSTEIVSRTNIIKITATSGDSNVAVKLANTVGEVYVEENLSEKTKQARAARQFIEEQLTVLKKKFAETEERLRNMEEQVKGIKLTEPIQDKLINLEFELASLLQKYTDKHPMVVQMQEQIKGLEAQLKGFSGQQLEYARLLREVEVNKKLYPMLSEKFEEARITEAQKVSDVSIVAPAVMASSPTSPQKRMGVLVGGLMGLILGSILAFVSETLDTSIGTIDDVEKVIKLSVLGVVPSVDKELLEKKSPFLKLRRNIFSSNKKKEIEVKETYIRLFVHHRPKSSVAEAYRNIRTNLKLGPGRKTILVTSAAPREGKTTILANLGLVIAQTGAKTLLISSDLRRPGLEKSFGLKKEPGFTEVVLGGVSLTEAIRNVSDIMLGDIKFEEITKTPGIENISILPCGHSSLNPAEILEQKKVISLIEELKRKFDVILFDSPPVLPITDASLLCSKVDSVVLVYEIGRTSRDALLRTKIQLESSGAKILGIILNHTKPQIEAVAPYPYYSKYKYRNYYGKESLPESTKTGKGQEKNKKMT